MRKLLPAMVLSVPIAVLGQQFEVASIKLNDSGAKISDVRLMPGGRLRATNVSLRLLITNAYKVRGFQVSGGPAWLDSAKFDLDAKSEGSPNPDQMSQMLRALLEDRFQLKVHTETKELPIFALTVAKNGRKLESSRGGDCFDPQAGVPPPPPTPGQMLRICGSFNILPGHMVGANASMPALAAALARFLGRTVVDKTGLGGAWDVNLQWAPEDIQPSLTPADPAQSQPDGPGPSLFTAIQEQLGLKLESQKGPVETLVIDHAEKPSAN